MRTAIEGRLASSRSAAADAVGKGADAKPVGRFRGVMIGRKEPRRPMAQCSTKCSPSTLGNRLLRAAG